MKPTYPEYEGQIILITGVASGIGAKQAQAFLDNGAKVFGADIKDNETVQALRKNANFHFQKVDVRSLDQLKDWVAKVETPIQIVLNTAGILDDYATTLDTPEKSWDNIFDTNLKSIYHVTNLVLPDMLKTKHGVFVNMASIAGLVAGGGGAAYTATKHAIIGYTKQLDYDYASQGIRANCIAPGAINTPMNAADFAGDGVMAKQVASMTPAKRWATPQEVADLTLYLASKGADYVHGAVVPIDGGWIEQ